jgi:hypothetical protein
VADDVVDGRTAKRTPVCGLHDTLAAWLPESHRAASTDHQVLRLLPWSDHSHGKP